MKSTKPLLVGVLALSVLLRLGAAFYLGNTVTDLPGTFDQISYHTLALRLLDGHGFTFDRMWWPITLGGEPTAHWSYVYTLYLAQIYSLFGRNPLVARLIQAVIVGLAHPLLAFLLGRRLYNERVGLAAAAATAVYVYFFYYAAALMTEPFYITTILASLFLAICLAQTQRRGYGLALVLGLVVALTITLRQLFLLIVPFIFLWIVWSGGRRKIAPLVLTTAMIVMLIAPFTIYNYGRFGQFVLLNTNAGYAFFWGNHPVHGTHFEPILPREKGSYQSLIPDELRHLDEAALDRALMSEGLQFIVDDPGRYILLSLSRIPPYFMFWPSADSSLISNVARVSSFGLMLPFMLVGLWMSLRRSGASLPEFLAAPATLLYLFMGVYTGIHLMSWALVRYRLPVDGVLLVFAGLTIVTLWEALETRRYTGRVSHPSMASQSPEKL